MRNHTTELAELQSRVHASYSAFLLLEFYAALPYPDGARLAAAERMKRAWESVDDLKHALRGEYLAEAAVIALAKEDRANFDALIEEDSRRDALARKKRNTDLVEEAA